MLLSETHRVYHYYQSPRKPGAAATRAALSGVDKKCNYELNMNPPVPGLGLLINVSQQKHQRERERGMSEEIFPLMTMTTVKHSQVLVI